MQPHWEVADVLRQADLSLLRLNNQQRKTLKAIEHCRTSALGGHIDVCSDCATIHISYNSCRNRHCPKCQGHKRAQWIQSRMADLLPCTYYHVVFTLPQQINPLAVENPVLVYTALFKAAWQTLQQFGTTAGLQLGMIAVLHTWGQNLSVHPHLHCIVPGGGINSQNKWQKQLRSNNYLFAVKALSKVFRAKYVALLRAGVVADQLLLDSLFDQPWVVYAKRPFAGPAQVIEYLGRYTHKVAISNHRIKLVQNKQVSFSYKDYRDKVPQQKLMTLSATEFIRRFSQHILPHRFVRIRHYGILSSNWKRGRLQKLQQQLNVIRPVQQPQTMLRKCPCCKTGTLITLEIFGKRGPPENYLWLLKSIPDQTP
jgi:hypothetical protein